MSALAVVELDPPEAWPLPALTRASCVVVAFHRPGALRRLLVGLHHPHLELVVVNVEDDPAVRRAARDATIVPIVGNPGYAAAVNAGVAAATGPAVVFMNDDVVLAADAVLRLVDALAGGADVAVPQVVGDDGAAVRTITAVPSVGTLAREWLALPDRPVRGLGRLRVQKWRLPDQPERIDAAAAVVVAAPRDLLLTVPLPESYFLYWEESEWFWRLRDRGARVEYRPEARCRHGGGRHDVRADKSRLLARNVVRCVRRTQGRAAGLGAYLVGVVWNLRLALADSLRLLRHPDRPHRSRMAARWAGVAAALASVRELA